MRRFIDVDYQTRKAMSDPEVEWLGTSCGKHGSYTFYKGFKLTANGRTKKYNLGEFYFVRNSKDRPICIAELQLVWHDSNTGNQLASARLYFRPESTPLGRQNNHGKDELLYTDEKVVVKCRDMMNLECDATEWCYGIKAISELSLQEVKSPRAEASTDEGDKKYRLPTEIFKQKNCGKNGHKEAAKVVILTFPAYCRYKSLMKKLSNGLVLSKAAILAFGGVIQNNNRTWVLFSRECFHHPELDKFDVFSDNKAPVLKGRPRKKKTKAATKHGKAKGKQNSGKDTAFNEQNTVDTRASPEPDSSDDNQTDTSEDSSSGIQELLPYPPKLVSAVKEIAAPFDMSQGVLRTVKQSGVVKPLAIPPIPKLVKIEPTQNQSSALTHTQKSVVVETVAQTSAVTISRMENIAPKLTSTAASVISSTQNIRISREEHARVSNVVSFAPSRTDYPKTNTFSRGVLHPGTITASQPSVSRTSAIVSTSRLQDVSRAVTGSENNVDSDRHVQCPNDAKQTLKRKRGRPAGRPTKSMKGQETEVEQRVIGKASPLQPVEMNVAPLQAKSERVTSPVEKSLIDEEDGSSDLEDALERAFMTKLKTFMKKRGTPIEKIPALGFKKINLYKMFDVTRSLGGYDVVTAKRLWRRVYNEVGGSPSITSAATNSRKHYERLLLPYEKYMSGQEPLVVVDKSDTPPPPTSSESDSPPTQRDQNSNVISNNDCVSSAQNQTTKSVLVSENKPEHRVHTSEESTSSVEFISSGSRGSPIVLYSSPVEQPPPRVHPEAIEISPPPAARYEPRPRVITSVGRDRTSVETRSISPELNKPPEVRSYVTEIVDDEPCVYTTPRSTGTSRTLKEEYEYLTTMDHVNERRATHAHESRRECYVTQRRDSTPEMIHDVYNGGFTREVHTDGVLMMNVRKPEGKYRSHYNYSPIPHDEPYLPNFTVPVLQQSHYPLGVELYDLPNSGFPLRTSSRIFMPSSHQLYQTHPAISPYPHHFITESGAIYQIPVPGYYPTEIPYPLEGLPVLRS